MLKLCSFLHMYELPSDASHRDKLELPSVKEGPVTKSTFARKRKKVTVDRATIGGAPQTQWHTKLLTTFSYHSQVQSTQEEFASLLQEIIKDQEALGDSMEHQYRSVSRVVDMA